MDITKLNIIYFLINYKSKLNQDTLTEQPKQMQNNEINKRNKQRKFDTVPNIKHCLLIK